MKKIEMTGVPETMIQTLYARAMESEREGHLIYDKKAMEIVKEMDYDFTKAKEDAMMRNGVVARTIVLDELVQNYVTAHPNAVVINIACGLDTRFYRVDNGKLRWFNLDLPVTIEVRKKFLEETGRVSVLPYSAMDEAWAEEVHKTLDAETDLDNETCPTLVIIEGLTMYLSQGGCAEDICNYPKTFYRCNCTGGNHVSICSKTYQRKIHRSQQSEIYLGCKERTHTGKRIAGL